MKISVHPETLRRMKVLADAIGPAASDAAFRAAMQIERRVKDELFAIHGERWLQVWRNQVRRG